MELVNPLSSKSYSLNTPTNSHSPFPVHSFLSLAPPQTSTNSDSGVDTTRAPRPGEQNGISYHFTSRESFKSLVDRDGFIEHAEFSGNLYGSSVESVNDVTRSGKMCILDIDTQVRNVQFLLL